MSSLDGRVARLEQAVTEQAGCYCMRLTNIDLDGHATTDHPGETCTHGRPWWLSVELVEVPRAHGQGAHA